jgi:hypothetical protein
VARRGKGLAVRRRDPQLPLAAAALVVASFAVRAGNLDGQSYWSDEIFSVTQARQPMEQLLQTGRLEVHTPLYAVLLHAWMELGRTHVAAWTRLLSTVLTVLAVGVAGAGLRSCRLSREAVTLGVVSTATSGFCVVYSVEARAYALALLVAVGVTSASLRAHQQLLEGRAPSWRGWSCWAVLAATAHLLGALLVCVLAGALASVALRNQHRLLARAVCGRSGLAVSPQLLWLGVGAAQPGFAHGTGWIPPARVRDVVELLTSTFSAGYLTPRVGGFTWRAPWGIGVVTLLAALGAALRRASVPEAAGDYADPNTPRAGTDPTAARFLLGTAAWTIGIAFALAQVVHVWTLRNMIVVVPALTWGTACGLSALPGTARGRRLVAWLMLGAWSASLVLTSWAVQRPYKTDFRAAVEYLITTRARRPEASFVFLEENAPQRLAVASDRPLSDPALRHVFDGASRLPHSRDPIAALQRLPGPEVVVYYTNIADTRVGQLAARMANQLGPGCDRVPIYGLAVVSCPEAGAGEDPPVAAAVGGV